MLSQIRNVWKAASLPFINSQLFVQYCRIDVPRICQRQLSVLPTQTSLLSRLQCPTSNQAVTLSDKKPLLLSTPVTLHSVRTNVREHYKGSAWKRYNKYNIEKRLTTPGGLEILWRRVLKGKHQLAIYERILPNTVNGKILPEHHFRYKAHPLTKQRMPKPGLY